MGPDAMILVFWMLSFKPTFSLSSFTFIKRLFSFSSKKQASFNFMAVVTICSDFGAQENKVCHCFHFFHIYSAWSDGTRCHDLSFFKCWVLSQSFHSPLSPSSRGSLVPLHFLPLDGIIFISEIIDISPGNLDSSLWFIQPGISHNVLCIQVK